MLLRAMPLALCLAALAVAAPALAEDPPAQATSPFDVTKMPGGVEYREIVVGTGASAYPGNTVSVQYTGWLRNEDGSRGMKFDSSANTGQPLQFMLGEGKVIRGWEMGMQGMKVGGKRRLIIPPSLAYGAKGTAAIPPYSTLIFDVELVGVK